MADFEEIEWDEALSIASDWLGEIRNKDPKKLAFVTGRDQSRAFTSWWASKFGTPNYASQGGFSSVNMAAGGHYTIGGSLAECGEPDWERTRYFMMFGCAEGHNSIPMKLGISKLRENGAKFISVNPVRTGYSATADEWLGIRPGTDGLFILSIIQELLKAGKIDVDYLIRYTNAPWLVITDQGAANGLFVRTADDKPIIWDRQSDQPRLFDDPKAKPALKGEIKLASGRTAVPAFQLLAERYLDPVYDPDAVSEVTGIPADIIRRIAAELAEAAFEQEIVVEQPWTDALGRTHDKMIGRPVAIHAMHGLTAHSNGFHTCRALHILQTLLGSIDCPGGYRYKPPFPKQIPSGPIPSGKPDQVGPNKPLTGPSLGFVTSPDDLLIDAQGKPCRLDKALSWEAPLAAQGMIHEVIKNAYHSDPYSIDTLLIYGADMVGTSTWRAHETVEMLTEQDEQTGDYRIPKIICSDAYVSEMVAYADLVLPDTTFLECWDGLPMTDLPMGSADICADSIRQPILEPDPDVRPFQDFLLDLGQELSLPGMISGDGRSPFPGGYSDYLVNYVHQPWSGTLMGWRGTDAAKKGKGTPNKDQLQHYADNGCFWFDELPADARYFKHANQAYLNYAVKMGLISEAKPVTLQLYSEVLQKFRLAADGHSDVHPPQNQRQRIRTFFDPMPFWYPPFEDITNDEDVFPLHAVTQRPMAMHRRGGSANQILRQIQSTNRLYMSRTRAEQLGISENDWVWIISRRDRIKGQVRLMDGVNDQTVWSWNVSENPDDLRNLATNGPQHDKELSLHQLIDDHLPAQSDGSRQTSADPITGQVSWHDLRVRLELIDPKEIDVSEPNVSKPSEIKNSLPKARKSRKEARRREVKMDIPAEVSATKAKRRSP